MDTRCFCLVLACSGALVYAGQRTPNIILFIADDMGYGDLALYGHPTQEWGPIDNLGRDGMTFSQFYSISGFCTPSRTSLLTGRYPMRSGMYGSLFVHLPCMNNGLPHSEITIAEALRDAGYATGIVGKWHQGINAHSHDDGSYLPHTHGFDYVEHILPHTLVWDCDTSKRHRKKPKLTKSFLYRNTSIVQQPIDLETLTSTLLLDAKAFVYNNQDKPFFLVYSFPQVHSPMFNMDRFRGKSKRGAYGDQINEMSWAVGEIIDLIKDLGLDEATLSVFVSDHGPHKELCEEGGDSGVFKGGKGNMYEGALRIPAMARWPGTIPAGVRSTSLLSLMDLFSTFIELGNGHVPDDRIIDSLSFAKLLNPPETAQNFNCERDGQNYYNQEIRQSLFFYCMDQTFIGVRYRQFKIYFRVSSQHFDVGIMLNCNGSVPVTDYYHETCMTTREAIPPLIYNIEHDPGEKFPLHYHEHKDMIDDVLDHVRDHMRTTSGYPEPNFVRHKCKRKYIPCCNPPYCVCRLS